MSYLIFIGAPLTIICLGVFAGMIFTTWFVMTLVVLCICFILFTLWGFYNERNVNHHGTSGSMGAALLIVMIDICLVLFVVSALISWYISTDQSWFTSWFTEFTSKIQIER